MQEQINRIRDMGLRLIYQKEAYKSLNFTKGKSINPEKVDKWISFCLSNYFPLGYDTPIFFVRSLDDLSCFDDLPPNVRKPLLQHAYYNYFGIGKHVEIPDIKTLDELEQLFKALCYPPDCLKPNPELTKEQVDIMIAERLRCK